MTKGRKVAIWICIIISLEAIIATILLKILSPDNTISKVILWTSLKNPLLTLNLGVLIGHWVFPQTVKK